MSSFAFKHPVISFESKGIDIPKIISRVYDFWDKNLDNTTLVNGHQIREVQDDEVIQEEANKILQQCIVPAVQAYVDTLTDSKFDFGIGIHVSNIWINVAEPGSYHRLHVHGNSHLHAVYYLQTAENCGDIILTNPYMTGLESLFHSSNNCVSLTAARGRGFLFSSNLAHQVDVNRSDADRISLAFEIKLTTVQ